MTDEDVIEQTVEQPVNAPDDLDEVWALLRRSREADAGREKAAQAHAADRAIAHAMFDARVREINDAYEAERERLVQEEVGNRNRALILLFETLCAHQITGDAVKFTRGGKHTERYCWEVRATFARGSALPMSLSGSLSAQDFPDMPGGEVGEITIGTNVEQGTITFYIRGTAGFIEHLVLVEGAPALVPPTPTWAECVGKQVIIAAATAPTPAPHPLSALVLGAETVEGVEMMLLEFQSDHGGTQWVRQDVYRLVKVRGA